MTFFKCVFKYKILSSMRPRYFHKVSNVFPYVDSSSSQGGKSLSNQHMLENGIVFNQNNGLYALLPLGVRAIEKLTKILDSYLQKHQCQKISLPLLTSASLWEKSGRLATAGVEVMKIIDRRDQEFILSPTHEESITYLISNIQNLRKSHLPIKLYQINTKFRDEMRLKHGLLRGMEFVMKDLYTFDQDISNAEETFKLICKIYEDIFKHLEIPIIKVEADVGSIGGINSKEFHIPSSIGEDILLVCDDCQYAINGELNSELSSCPVCNGSLKSVSGIEVGHAFLLGTKYSSTLSGVYRDEMNKPCLLQMGCYGIGVTRLLAAGIESLSTENKLVWPKHLVPFKVCIIPPKKGSKESISSYWGDHFTSIINQLPGYEDEVIVDDRIKLSIGQRLNWASKFGFPVIIVIGKSSTHSIPHFEVINFSENLKMEMTQCAVLQYLKEMEEKSF